MAEETDKTSAPELPGHIAKQYGLPHDEEKASGVATHPVPTSVVDDPRTEDAVDDIVHRESDALLDGGPALSVPSSSIKKRPGIVRFFRGWWHNKWARYATLLVLVIAITTVASVQKLRYAVLNTAGVRSSASIVVLDNTTQLPLKNVIVSLGGMPVATDIDGKAVFSDLKLGDYSLRVHRVAFAGYEKKITIGWGSNPLGTVKLRATGTQYVLHIADYVSNKPVAEAEVVSDEFNALSDASGKVVFTIEDMDVNALWVTVQAEGYRREHLRLDANRNPSASVVLVPAKKDVFVTKQSGKYDVYSSDLDGKNRKLLLAGTGLESPNMSLVVNPDGSRAALVSTRDNMRDSDGYIMTALTIIDIKQGTSVTVDHAEQIQLVDWIGDRLVYRLTIAGASAANPQRNRLISLHFDTNSRIQLAAANQFNTILSARGMLYYAASSTDPEATLGLFRVKPDGTERKRLSDEEVWTGMRTTYDTLSLQTPDSWFTYSLSKGQLAKSAQPASLTPYTFVTNGNHSAWTDMRDGKGTLLVYDIAKDKHRVLHAQEGLTNPVRWFDDHTLIYRVSTGSETANYVVSLKGGSARKITDVTPTYGYAQAF